MEDRGSRIYEYGVVEGEAEPPTRDHQLDSCEGAVVWRVHCVIGGCASDWLVVFRFGSACLEDRGSCVYEYGVVEGEAEPPTRHHQLDSS